MKKLFVLPVLFILLNCSKKEESGKDVISPNNMRDILIQIHLAESKIQQLNLPEDSSKALFIDLSNNIYKNANVDSSLFKKSYQYYAQNSEKFDKIYGEVVDSLSLKEARKIIE